MSQMEARIQTSCPNSNRDVPPWRSEAGAWACREQKGAVAVIFAMVLCVLVGFCGLALDLARVYNRKVEVQNVADVAALAAARKLNGTATGISDARSAAAAAAAVLKYEYNATAITWSDSAIKFSTSPDRNGDWVDAGTAAGIAAGIFFVKVDTSQLAAIGGVSMVFMPVVSSSLTTATMTSDAIAGRVGINVSPLAICAMSTTPAASRTYSPSGLAELVEYGFRRGVSYDLMKLNPGGSTAVNFLVNPLAKPGTPGVAADALPAAVGPYVCAGSLGIPHLAGGTIAISQPFPLDSLYKQLNSRFDQYDDGLCNFHAAPPDNNIQSYVFGGFPPPFAWTITAPTVQTAASTTSSPLRTIADVAPVAGTAAQYGPVWAYAKAVPFSSYIPGAQEPANGYTTFTATNANWSTLYPGQNVRTYPGGALATPYKATVGTNFAPPNATHKPSVKDRRVLNVPLLSCSGAAGAGASATVLAIGKFFMMVPATATSIAAEFAGAVPVQNVEGQVELFP
jgi:Flp pilus assembly protein TadG